MKIVHLYKDYFPPTVGGIEQTVNRLARGQARDGAEVTVLTSHPGVRRTLCETVEGVHVIRCAEHGRLWSTPICPSMPGALGRLQADVFHLHYPSPPGEVSLLLARPCGAVVLTWHCEIVRQKLALPVYGLATRAVLERANAIHATYEQQPASTPMLQAHLSKCHVVPLGVELEPFERTPAVEAAAAEIRKRLGTPLVVFVGRLVSYKGLDVLLSAIRAVPCRLVVVGGGPEAQRLAARATALGVADRVTFTGRVPASELVHYVAASDIGVLPSVTRAEAFGLSMVEMMSAGLPMVCTDVGTGTTQVNCDGETGFVVPPGDSGKLADALLRLLSDEPLRLSMGARARHRARCLFSAETMVRGVSEVYAAALRSTRSVTS